MLLTFIQESERWEQTECQQKEHKPRLSKTLLIFKIEFTLRKLSFQFNMKSNYKPHGSRCTPCRRHEVCMRFCHAWVLQFNYSREPFKFNFEMPQTANGMSKSFPLQHWLLAFFLPSACQYLPFYQSCRLGVMLDFFLSSSPVFKSMNKSCHLP